MHAEARTLLEVEDEVLGLVVAEFLDDLHQGLHVVVRDLGGAGSR